MRKLISIFILLFTATTISGQRPKLVLPIGHTAAIRSAQFSSNGKWILTGSDDKTARVWDAASGSLIQTIEGGGAVRDAQFSQDGKYIVTLTGPPKVWETSSGKLILELRGTTLFGSVQFNHSGKLVLSSSLDGTAKVWEVATGKVLVTCKGHKGKIYNAQVYSAQFSPDEKLIITTSDDSTAKIWESSSGKLVQTLPGHSAEVYFAMFSPDGKLILTYSKDGTSRVWDSGTGKLLYLLNEKIPFSYSKFMSARFSPDSKWIVTVSSDKKARVWDAVTGNLRWTLDKHFELITSVQFSPDGKLIVTASIDGTARVWESSSGRLLRNLFSNGSGTCFSAEFNTNGKQIVTAYSNGTAKTWESSTGKLVYTLKGYTSYVNSLQPDGNGNRLITVSSDWTARVWGIHTGKILFTLPDSGVSVAQLSPRDKWIATGSTRGSVKIWDATSFTVFRKFTRNKARITSLQFSPDEKSIITTSGNWAGLWEIETGRLLDSFTCRHVMRSPRFSPDGKFIVASSDSASSVWEIATGKLIATLPCKSSVSSSQFSPDGKWIVTTSGDSIPRLWEAKTGKLVYELKAFHMEATSAQFSPDSKFVLTAGYVRIARLWETQTGEFVRPFTWFTLMISAKFSPDGKKILTTANDNTATLWETATGNRLQNFEGHSSYVSSGVFSSNGNSIITTSGDNTIKYWNALNGQVLLTFFALGASEYFAQVPSGYYYCSPGAAKLLHYVTPDLKVISFEQLDVKYNRPDKVLQELHNQDTLLIKSYNKAYLKRIKKLAIDTTAFRDEYSVPEADFTDRDKIEQQQKEEKLTLHIKGSDAVYKLDRFNVWINEVPVYGQRGISIRKRNKNDLDTTISIKLSSGENRVETSIFNVNGTESYRMPLVLTYIPSAPKKEITHFIGIGIDQFADTKYNLQYGAKDIRDLCAKLKEKYGDSILIDTLFNNNVTVQNVKALKKKLQQTTENDKVILAYSGHGLLSRDYDYYLSTYAVNFDKPEENGLPYDELENLLDSIPARKKLMLIDACHSGELDKEDLISIDATADSMKLKKGIKPVAYKRDEKHLGLKNSFELMQSLFVNVGKSTGATIISAAAGTQFALERGDLKNGVFTYSILEAMNKYPTLKISELKKIVGERVEQLTDGKQKPTSRNETIEADWSVW